MIDALRIIAIRLAVCAAATWCVWRLGFDTGVPFMAGLLGIALARPVIDLAIALWHELRRAVWHDVQGRYFAYKGRPVRVTDDAGHRRWVRLADIRAIVGFTASDASLQVTYPAAGASSAGRPNPICAMNRC